MSETGNEKARAKGRMLRGSPIKLNMLAAMIRGEEVGKAKAMLAFSRKRMANDVLKVLDSAVANAENNHGMDVDMLVVDEAYVGKNLVMKRWLPRARGRAGRLLKPFSQITIILRQREQA